MMSFTGVPTYVEAQIITIPAGIFEIAGGCSGLRYMIVSLAISSLFIFLNIRDTKRALLFLTMTILGALLTNWIRITALILIGEYTNMESSLMEDHNTFGWYLYVPFMVLLFVWGNKVADIDVINSTPASTSSTYPNNFTIVFSGLFFLIISSTTFKGLLTPSMDSTIVHNNINNLAIPTIYHYSSIKQISSYKQLDNINYNIYEFDGRDLDAKPTYYNNNLTPDGWKITKVEETPSWHISYLVKGNKKALIFSKYEISGQITTTQRKFRVMRLIQALSNINKSKLHWVFTDCETDCSVIKMKLLSSTL